MGIRWPRGKGPTKFTEKVKKVKKDLLEGRVVSIDPGSKSAGYAVFEKGKMIESSTVNSYPKLPINTRLSEIFKGLPKEPQPDVVIIEDVGNGTMAHVYLKYAVGAILAGYPSPVILFCPISFWKAYNRDMKIEGKDDELDAQSIGLAIIQLAKELNDEN